MTWIFDRICWVMWQIGDLWDTAVAEVIARWETRNMNADQIIAHVKAMASEGPDDKASMIMRELCEHLEQERRGGHE
jgi:hypothetical protein